LEIFHKIRKFILYDKGIGYYSLPPELKTEKCVFKINITFNVVNQIKITYFALN